MMRQTTTFKVLGLTALTTAILALSGCKTISEDACLSGNWEAIGLKDGANGRSPDRLSKIAKSCGKYGAVVDNAAYLSGYEAGLPQYCTFQRGFERGQNGNSYNQVCSGELAEDYAPGYEEGRIVYQIYSGHEQLLDEYRDREEAIYRIRKRLKEEELSEEGREKLIRRVRRIERELKRLRYEIRDYERRYDLPRSRL